VLTGEQISYQKDGITDESHKIARFVNILCMMSVSEEVESDFGSAFCLFVSIPS